MRGPANRRSVNLSRHSAKIKRPPLRRFSQRAEDGTIVRALILTSLGTQHATACRNQDCHAWPSTCPVRRLSRNCIAGGPRSSRSNRRAAIPCRTIVSICIADLLGEQQVLVLDLKQPVDRGKLDAHLATADLLITSTLPASLARLGLAWTNLHAAFPQLCQVAIVGHAPPDEELTGHDLTYQAVAGLLSPPAMPLTLLADMAGAQTAVSHALAVLAERARGPARECLVGAHRRGLGVLLPAPAHGLTVPGGRLAGELPYYNIYPTREGWLAVAALEPQFWARLQSLLQLEDGTRQELASHLPDPLGRAVGVVGARKPFAAGGRSLSRFRRRG